MYSRSLSSVFAVLLALPIAASIVGCGASGAAYAGASDAKSGSAASSGNAHVDDAKAASSSDSGSATTRINPNVSLALDSSECAQVKGDEVSVALFKRGCDGGDATGCHELFVRYMCGVGVPQDSNKALEAASRGCDLGLIEACSNAGLFAQRQGGEKNLALARKLMEKACTAGDVPACNNLGTIDMMSPGAGPTRAAALFEKMCAKGNVMSCANLAQILAVGLGEVPRDAARAQTLAASACDANNFVACNVVGILYAQSTPANSVGAAKAWKKACDLGAPASCDNLAQLYQAGAGVDQDATEAMRLYRRACSAGVAHACTALGQLGASANVLGSPVTNASF